MKDHHRWVGAAALALAVSATISCTSRVSECVPGEQDACACPGGTDGVQVCRDDETYGACSCDGTGTDGTDGEAGGAGGAAGTGTGAGAGTGGPAPGTATTISTGSARLVQVFATADRVVVVLEDEVRILDLAGTVVATWPAPRAITAGAFDGNTLAVADTAVLHTFTTSLELIASVDLVETCADLVVVSGPRVVCGPEDEWDRIFYTYDTYGTLLATSAPYTYHGTPMRRVPGSDEFVTVSVGHSPSDFHLYALGSNGEATFINESPYHGDFGVIDVYAFQGMPASHLVTHAGVILRLHGPDCAAGSSFESGCFVKDGMLGTLAADTMFRGMATAADGQRMFAVVDSTQGWYPCETGCVVQRIDLAQKIVTAEQPVAMDPEQHVLLSPVPDRDVVVVGFTRAAEYYPEPSPGHRVDLVAF